MLGRVIAYTLFGCMIIAFVLSFAGVTEVYLGNGMTDWLRLVTSKFDGWKLQIPKIPNIRLLAGVGETGSFETPLDMNGDGKTTLGEFFGWLNSKESVPKKILNVLIYLFNFIINILNVVVMLFNMVIQVVQFILTMVYCVKDLPSYLTSNEWLRWNDEESIWWWRSVGHSSVLARTIV